MDVHKIREFLLLEWKKYEKRDCDLVSVSFTATAAIDSVRRLEEHFAAAFPNMASYQVLAKQSYELEVLRENPEGPLDSPIYARCCHVANWLFYSTTTMLRTYANTVQQVHFLCPSDFHTYHLNAHRYVNSDKLPLN